jgi:hypothetical protein
MKLIVMISVLVTASTAFASLPVHPRQISFSTPAAASTSPDGFPVRPLTWDQFKDSCKNPGQYQAQRPAENIKVVCRDQRWSWVLSSTAGSKDLDQSRAIGTELFSDKFHVVAATNQVCADPLKVGCPVYNQVELDMNTEQAVTCDDVANFAGSITDFCEGVLNNAYNSNPGSYSSTPTGKSANLCDGGGTQTNPNPNNGGTQTTPNPNPTQASGLFNPNLN